MRRIKDIVNSNYSLIKWVVIVVLLALSFMFASCAEKTYESSDQSASIDSLVLKSYLNSSFVWKDSTVVVVNEAGDVVRTHQKTYIEKEKEKLVYKDRYKYINRRITKTVTVKKKYVPLGVILGLVGSVLANIAFAALWLKGKSFGGLLKWLLRI